MDTWEGRCYENGIPDEVPHKLAKSGRVPSYKAIALAILRNDLNFYTLGFMQPESKILDDVIRMKKEEDSDQLRLI